MTWLKGTAIFRQTLMVPTIAAECHFFGNFCHRINRDNQLHHRYLKKLNTDRLEIFAKLDCAASRAIIFACSSVIAVA